MTPRDHAIAADRYLEQAHHVDTPMTDAEYAAYQRALRAKAVAHALTALALHATLELGQ